MTLSIMWSFCKLQACAQCLKKKTLVWRFLPYAHLIQQSRRVDNKDVLLDRSISLLNLLIEFCDLIVSLSC